jgi:steroid 5-alpha reductase family enzyme
MSLHVAMIVCAAVAFTCWLLSVINRNYSQVDRLWSILPFVYTGSFAAYGHFADLRVDLMFALSLLWGARLTFNFWRKGGYRPGGEDYRWPILQKRYGPVLFQIFNATFIAPFQNALLLCIAIPAWVALQHGAPIGWRDIVIALVFVALLVTETIADQQQWSFHVEKHARIERGEPVDEPFLTRGLFAHSRHPNFFCEISMWWCMYAFSVVSGAGYLQPGLIGCVVLTLLFQGSTQMTEQVTLGKYPSYAEYQKRVSRLIPLP